MEEKDNKIVHEHREKASLSGMYETWFLEYASYVILERAVPYIYDGLKPVQRRILHAMKQLDDGRYNKVANIIGNTMQYHPHGDASIGDALVQLGQKDILIDTQGNWGNILTADRAAAPRYIEARLSKFALDVVYNAKTTEWKLSYDGRNKEPVCLPVKFPLLLAQGAEGIAVGLASKILPHNFIELINASIKHLKGEDFELYPDFLTGGMADVSKYNDGLRGGKVRVRAKINKVDKKTLSIIELPFGKSTNSLIDSILLANEKGKIKIRKIEDNTAAEVEILIHLQNGTSPDKTIDALYAFTDCEISISPNACIIEEKKPRFVGVRQILRENTDNTKQLLKTELEIKLSELYEAWHLTSLEKIFIKNRLYLLIEECETWEEIIETIDRGLDPYKKLLRREVVHDDIVRLTEIKIKRISRYDSFKADTHLKTIEEQQVVVKRNLEYLTDYTIKYFERILEKYGKDKKRRTEIRSFDNIEAAQVAVANAKLYVNRREGFAGTSLKKDEFISDCSDIDDIIVFRKDGTYTITKVSEKAFFGKNIIHVDIFKRNNNRTIYNSLYQDGVDGNYMGKRFAVTGITRDKEYTLTRGTPNSKVVYFTSNPNGEAEIIRIVHKPKKRLRVHSLDFDFSTIDVKGRNTKGNIVTRHTVHRITIKEKGKSTLGGRNIWFDFSVLKLNTEERGDYIGEFSGDEKLIAFTKSGYFMLHDVDLLVRFEDDIIKIEKYAPEKVYTSVFYDADPSYKNYYVKRFKIETDSTINRKYSLIGEYSASKLIELNDNLYPRLELTYGGANQNRENEFLEVDEFIGLKSHKAHGKRISIYKIAEVKFVAPTRPDEIEEIKEIETVDEEHVEEADNGQTSFDI